MHNTRDSFGSKFGAIAALAGSAVGLGNIWKFPYEVGNNGGGAFLLVYIFFTVAIGLPVMLSEFALGRYSGRNAFGTFDRLEPKTAWRYFGVLVLLAATMILSFYGTIAGWTLEYVFKSFTFSFHANTNVNLNSMFSDFITNPYKPVFWQIVFMALTGFIVLAGVKKGIERYTKLMMPGMYAGRGHGRDKISFLTQVLRTYFAGSTFCSGTSLFLLVNWHGGSLDLRLLHQKR